MMPDEYPPLRWGILGTARINRRNWAGMRDSGAATLVALASRDRAKAAAFIDELQAAAPWPEKPVAHGSYESLLASEDIEAVYIPLPTGLRKKWVIRAAEAGKHVLCEKPCAINADDLLEMTRACERNGVLFMDGVMFMHDPRFPRLREILDDGETVGPIKRITSVFSFRGDDDFGVSDIRSSTLLEPAGCLGDLGWYCIRGSLWAMDWQLPHRVSGRILQSSPDSGGRPAITEFSAEMDFPGGVTAAFYCSFLSPGQMWLNISGTKGGIRIPDFVAPAADNDSDWHVNYARIPRAATDGMRPESRMFATFASEARRNPTTTRWAEISLKTQLVQDACERSALAGTALFLDGNRYLPAGC